MHTERKVLIALPPDRVWAALEQVDRYRDWWPWLRSLDARGLAEGDRWSCTVRPPLPYRVRFDVVLDAVVAETSIVARVSGDVAGSARIDLVPNGDGTTVALVADLQASSRWLQLVDRWAHPVARFGHDRIIARSMDALAAHVDDDHDHDAT